ncbi:MAG: ATP-grasp domain-containing protein [Desulfonatronovibrionaceae bacterium]
MKKHILILGAGVYQLPLIQKALDLGYHVSVASWDPDDPGMKMAHDPWVVSITDSETLLRLAREKQINAVATSGTDVCMPSLGLINDQLGLPGVSHKTALSCSSKDIMQRLLHEHGVPSAGFIKADTLEQAQKGAREIGYPVIVKAPDSSGSRGIQAAETPEEFKHAYENAAQTSKKDFVLVEKLLQGLEFGCQIIVDQGRVTHVLPHNDTITPPPVSVPVGHSCPFNASEEDIDQTARVCSAAVRALGIETAICNVDLMLTRDGVYMLEIGARIGATGIPEIVNLYYGIDLYSVALDMALGRPLSITSGAGRACAYEIIQAPLSGTVRKAAVPEHILENPDVQEVRFDVAPGDQVRKFQVGPDRIGHILTTGATFQDAEQLCRRVSAGLIMDIEQS